MIVAKLKPNSEAWHGRCDECGHYDAEYGITLQHMETVDDEPVSIKLSPLCARDIQNRMFRLEIA